MMTVNSPYVPNDAPGTRLGTFGIYSGDCGAAGGYCDLST